MILSGSHEGNNNTVCVIFTLNEYGSNVVCFKMHLQKIKIRRNLAL